MKMELEQMLHNAQDLSQRFHAVVGPWDGTLLVTHLAGVVGRLADDVMTIEGKLAQPVEQVHFARNIADAVMQLLRISNFYQIDLELAWAGFLEEARSGLGNEEIIAAMRETIHQNLERSQGKQR
jgi:hypothetical protein